MMLFCAPASGVRRASAAFRRLGSQRSKAPEDWRTPKRCRDYPGTPSLSRRIEIYGKEECAIFAALACERKIRE